MKAASIKQIKTELSTYPRENLEVLCLRLTKYKKENKELMSYLLFYSSNEDDYIKNVKLQMDLEFEKMNTTSFFLAKKTIRKVLRTANKYAKYSGLKRTETELIIYFCHKMNESQMDFTKSKAMENLYKRQIERLNKTIAILHEDLQYDYINEMKEIGLL